MLLDRLLPPHARQQVLALSSDYPAGTHRFRELVGDRDKGTSHPHDFYLDTDTKGAKLLFVDPENTVANRNRLRPPISNLMVADIPFGDDQPKVAVLRYRTPALQRRGREQDNPSFLKMDGQRTVAEALLEGSGHLPEALQGDLESEVLFWLFADGTRSVVEARYSTPKQLQQFARGGTGSSALEGKVDSQGHILNKFIKHLQHPENFKPV